MYSPHSIPSPGLLPLPATPTLSPLNQLTLDIIKFDTSGKVKLDETSGLPLTPTLSSPPFTPFKSAGILKVDFNADSPTFSSPPVTPLLKYHGPVTPNLDSSTTSLPPTPSLPSPPFTPMIKYNPGKNDTPITPIAFDSSSALPPTPIFCSPPFTAVIHDVEIHHRDHKENVEIPMPSMPETPTLPSPTFTPLISMSKECTPPPFNPLPLPETPSMASPAFTPAIKNKGPTFRSYSPLGTPTMESPIRTPGFDLRTPSSPFDSANLLSPSELDRDQDIWKQ